MIINIDDSKSVQAFVYKVTEKWFDPYKMYSDFKASGKTNSSGFWAISDQMLGIISEYHNQLPEEFLSSWIEKCSIYDAKIMGYHCTRHSNKKVFTEKGILPLSRDTIEISDERNQDIEAKEAWEYRSQRSPGPWFLLSYKDAKNPNNNFCINGPEILLACDGNHTGVDPANAIPLIIHCEIPYSILTDKSYYLFCTLRAYFNFIDPEDDLSFDGYSIDLNGLILEPQHIVKVEEVQMNL